MNKFPPMKQLEFEENPWPDVPYLIIKPNEDTDRSCLVSLLELTENLPELFQSHSAIDEEEPWFGWAFERSTGLQSELSLIKSIIQDEKSCALLDTYVQRVITYFKEIGTESGFYVHEEKEAGSDAILYLMYSNPEKYFQRYIEYLQVIDLEHTVAQADNINLIRKIITETQLTQLREALSVLNGREYMPDV
ncbi:hypothetical protein [Aliikangiella sp. IMCC44359]|uniref:hypothetical protein n=1 Tax=Aliikangiella sp. IMCC44359 TaxID=3459125 RepID=UPI00403ADE62